MQTPMQWCTLEKLIHKNNRNEDDETNHKKIHGRGQ